MIRAAFFDLDGTLLNRDSSVKRFIREQHKRLNLIEIPKEIYVNRFLELDNRGYVWKDKVYRQLTDEFKISQHNWEELLWDYISEFKNHCVPFPNLLNMLHELKRNQIRLGIITNGFGQFQLNNIRALGIEKFFEAILVSEWEGIKKPNPQIFMRALDYFKISPLETIYIGDHPLNDIEAAQNAGIKGIWKRDNNWENVKADFIIDDLAEVPVIIRKLNGPL